MSLFYSCKKNFLAVASLTVVLFLVIPSTVLASSPKISLRDSPTSINADDTAPQISDIYADPNPFNPSEVSLNGYGTKIYFTLNKAAFVTIRAFDSDHNQVKTFMSGAFRSVGKNFVNWNGKNSAGYQLSDGKYTYEIRACSTTISVLCSTKTGTVTVDNDEDLTASGDAGDAYDEDNMYDGDDTYDIDDTDYGDNIYEVDDNCEFGDLSTNSKYYHAMRWACKNNIFEGYDNGKIRPRQRINRYETIKVILAYHNIKPFENDGSNAGYWDVEKGSWPVGWLLAAKKYGIHGNPDGSFRGLDTVNNVELARIAVEIGEIDIPHCNYPPYNKNIWYNDYWCFLKEQNLLDVDKPGEPMTRGDVALILYKLDQLGY